MGVLEPLALLDLPSEEGKEEADGGPIDRWMGDEAEVARGEHLEGREVS